MKKLIIALLVATSLIGCTKEPKGSILTTAKYKYTFDCIIEHLHGPNAGSYDSIYHSYIETDDSLGHRIASDSAYIDCYSRIPLDDYKVIYDSSYFKK